MSELNFPPTLDELLQEFAELIDWDERYDYLIDLGKQLPPLPAESQSEANLVRGCMSTVWLETALSAPLESSAPEAAQGASQVAAPQSTEPVPSTEPAQPTMQIRADSDSLIVKGMIVVLLAVFNGRSPADILQADEHAAFAALGLNQHLSPQRRNGLFAMVKRVKQSALEASVAK
jgi:cysteine desulfuration protein SufE